MIGINFNGTDERVIAALRTRAGRLREGLTRTLNELMRDLQARIQRKLMGEVLKPQRGGLLRSVHMLPTEEHFGNIIGRVAAGGGVYWWARVHEEGGKKTYPILPGIVTGKSDKKALAFMAPGFIGVGGQGASGIRRLYFREGEQRGSLRPTRYAEFHAAGGIVVKAVMHPPAKRRSFMQSSLDELRSTIISRIYEGAARAIRG